MSQNEDLNTYKGAYAEQFKFYQENQWYLAHYADRVCSVLRQQKLQSLLSLGIGHQVVSERMIREFDFHLSRYTILEGSGEIIKNFKLKKAGSNDIEIVHTYFETYSGNTTFDAIEMGFVLEHVDDPAFILSKYAKLLRPGGVMFIAVPNARSLHRLIGHQAGLLDDVYKLSDQDHQLGHKRYFDLQSISELVECSGLKISNKQGLMLKPITGEQISRLEWGENIIQALFVLGDDYPEIANCILIEAIR